MRTLFLLLLASCQFSEYPAPVVGSTYRIERGKVDSESRAVIDLSLIHI